MRDRVKAREYQKRYRSSHPGQHLIVNKIWRDKNKDKTREYHRRDKERHPERIKQEHRIYYINNKEQISIRCHNHNQLPHIKLKNYNNTCRRRTEIRQWYNNIKSSLYCSYCGIFGGVDDNYKCLDFHHLRPTDKTDHVSRMVANRLGREKILIEIGKCIPVCKNCHTKI